MTRFVIEYAIVGNFTLGRYTHFYRFAGGRSRRKLEGIAKRMNDNGEAICRVLLVRRRQ